MLTPEKVTELTEDLSQALKHVDKVRNAAYEARPKDAYRMTKKYARRAATQIAELLVWLQREAETEQQWPG